MITNKRIRDLYRLVFLFLCEMGIVLQYAIVARIGNVMILSCYYTILSNIVCLIYFGALLLYPEKEENPMIKGGVVLWIMITGLVYHFMLNGAMEAGVGAVAEVTTTEVLANTLVHYVVPIMTFVDYLLFTPKGNFKWKYPVFWLSAPLVYSIFIIIRAEVSSLKFAGFSGLSRYPYPFIDIDLFGWGKVLLMLTVIFIAFWVLGLLITGLDHLLKKATKA